MNADALEDRRGGLVISTSNKYSLPSNWRLCCPPCQWTTLARGRLSFDVHMIASYAVTEAHIRTADFGEEAWGHLVHLRVPAALFLDVMDSLSETEGGG